MSKPRKPTTKDWQPVPAKVTPKEVAEQLRELAKILDAGPINGDVKEMADRCDSQFVNQLSLVFDDWKLGDEPNSIIFSNFRRKHLTDSERTLNAYLRAAGHTLNMVKAGRIDPGEAATKLRLAADGIAPPANSIDGWWTVGEAAQQTDHTSQEISKLCRAGKLDYQGHGRARRINPVSARTLRRT